MIVDTETYSPNHIDVRVHTQASPLWRLTGIYGHPEEQRKTETWRLMRHLHALASLPWVCLGDFNESWHPMRRMVAYIDRWHQCLNSEIHSSIAV